MTTDSDASCILISYKPNEYGYGKCRVKRFGRVIWRAHVLAWVDANGRLPAEGMQINHTCHNRACINPEHLYEGTHQDNMNDMKSAGRQKNHSMTHFKCGCEVTPENTYTNPKNGGRTCHKHRPEYQREYAQANKEKISERRREYRQAYKDNIKEQKREYYQANKEKILAQQKEYRQANKEKRAAQ